MQNKDGYDGERMETMEDDDDGDLGNKFSNLDKDNIKKVEVEDIVVVDDDHE